MGEAVPLAPGRNHAPLSVPDWETRQRKAAVFPIRRANAIREIGRISVRYGWEAEIDQALMEAGVPAVKYLDADRLEELLVRLHTLVDCLQTPCDPPDAPPAR